ncbi:MAG: 4Fe-4S binding protein [Syntrophales bacterium]|nr:4Fe-4S binding protein [Syntrophales bacterium]
MAKGVIEIKESSCRGCGFCEMFCKKGCIEMSARVSNLGLPLPDFSNPDNCIACGVCALMCPHTAIEVYEYMDTSSTAAH